MTNLDMRMEELRQQLENKYARGDKESALEISRRLDRLIAIAQREGAFGQVNAYPDPTMRRKANAQ